MSFEELAIDPNGKGQHEKGAKLDHGKPRVDVVLGGFLPALAHIIYVNSSTSNYIDILKSIPERDVDPILEICKVGTFGANKYTDGGWLEVPNGIQRYRAANWRHALYRSRELHDPESGLLHSAHGGWNALAEITLLLNEVTEVGKSEDIGALITQAEQSFYWWMLAIEEDLEAAKTDGVTL